MKPNKKYTKKQLKAFEKDAEPIESSATDPKFLTPSPKKWAIEFEDKFGENEEVLVSGTREDVKQFIKNLLTSQCEEAMAKGYDNRGIVEAKIKDAMFKEHKKELERQRIEIIEEIEKALPEEDNPMRYEENHKQSMAEGFNQCLEEVKTKLNKLKNK